MAETIKQRSRPVRPCGVNHLVINVRDIEESHHFWCDLLGFEQVGELDRPPDHPRAMTMRFYSGLTDDVSHHDIALVERPDIEPPPENWEITGSTCAINHLAITYPDRESWLEQVRFLRDQGVKLNARVDHGMTHSVYLSDPNGYGVEVLYELPEEVWRHDINGALNYSQELPMEQLLDDSTDYVTDFAG
ncbi:MAG TPA: hypothetical protein DEP69_07135 [Acidimicrobiaceae bacterium]|nr:hypothetical protein [Acidimicrobiaceae bacterium]